MALPDLVQRILAWIKGVDQSSGSVRSNGTSSRGFAIIAATMATGLVSSILATWLAQEILNYSFSLAVVIGMVIVLLFATVVQVRGLPFRPRPLQIVAFLLTLVMVQSVIIAYMRISDEPSTTYLVFDATESTIPYYGELVKNIRLTAQVQHPKSFGGLRIYGGEISGLGKCRDTIQLIPPTQAKEFEWELDRAFGSLDPKGHGSLTIAVLSAVKDDLSRYRGPIKLVAITSGLDPECEPSEPGIFEEIAADIRENTPRDITLTIIGVGNLTPSEEDTLRSYARAFGGTYLNASRPANLTSVILAPGSYFVDYGKAINEHSQP